MDIVLQVRLNAKESETLAARPELIDTIALTTVVAMETVQQVGGKSVTGEILDDKGTVLKTLP